MKNKKYKMYICLLLILFVNFSQYGQVFAKDSLGAEQKNINTEGLQYINDLISSIGLVGDGVSTLTKMSKSNTDNQSLDEILNSLFDTSLKVRSNFDNAIFSLEKENYSQSKNESISKLADLYLVSIKTLRNDFDESSVISKGFLLSNKEEADINKWRVASTENMNNIDNHWKSLGMNLVVQTYATIVYKKDGEIDSLGITCKDKKILINKIAKLRKDIKFAVKNHALEYTLKLMGKFYSTTKIPCIK